MEIINFILNCIEGSVGAFLMAGFGLLSIACIYIIFPITAFFVRWWWGVLCFLFPPTFLVFSVKHFDRAKGALIFFSCTTCGAIGMFVLRSLIGVFFSESGQY